MRVQQVVAAEPGPEGSGGEATLGYLGLLKGGGRGGRGVRIVRKGEEEESASKQCMPSARQHTRDAVRMKQAVASEPRAEGRFEAP